MEGSPSMMIDEGTTSARLLGQKAQEHPKLRLSFPKLQGKSAYEIHFSGGILDFRSQAASLSSGERTCYSDVDSLHAREGESKYMSRVDGAPSVTKKDISVVDQYFLSMTNHWPLTAKWCHNLYALYLKIWALKEASSWVLWSDGTTEGKIRSQVQRPCNPLRRRMLLCSSKDLANEQGCPSRRSQQKRLRASGI